MNKENKLAAQEKRRRERERKQAEKKALKIMLIVIGCAAAAVFIALIVISQVRTSIANKKAEESIAAYESSVEESQSESESASAAASEAYENGELNTDTSLIAENGDIVNIDYTGYLDGEAFDNGSAEGYDLTLGSDTFIDGFEDGIIGHSVGETFDLDLTFPENYGSEELAGQEVTFTVTLNGIYR